jgi:hypothetical protein
VVADLDIGRATAVQAPIGQGAGWDVQEIADLLWGEDHRDSGVGAGLISHAGQVCGGYRDVPDRVGCTRMVPGKIWRRCPIRGESGHQFGHLDHRWQPQCAHEALLSAELQLGYQDSNLEQKTAVWLAWTKL